MHKRELLGLAALSAAPALAVGYAALKARRVPLNAPAGFRRESAKAVVVCLGASMICGSLSFDVVDQLQARLGSQFQVVNAGVNGDLAWNALTRLGPVVDCDPDCVIVLIGSNDVMASLDAKSEKSYRKLKKLPVRPTLAWYGENLRGIVAELRARTRAKVALCSLPMLGEQLDAAVNQRLARYNEVIRETAREHGAEYLAVHEDLAAALGAGPANPRPFAGTRWPTVRLVIEHYVLGRSFDAIGQRRGYALLTDGIHLGSRAGGLVVARFEACVRLFANSRA